MSFGGMHPYPRRLGGGRPRTQILLDSLNANRGDAYDATNRETTVYVANLAIARAISAAWGTNERLGNMWIPARMSEDAVARWERLLAIRPAPDETVSRRRTRLQVLFSNFGQSAINGRLALLLTEALGDAFVAIEYIDFANANIHVPDGTYPWGTVVADAPWSSTIAHVLIKTQKPAGWTEFDFYKAVGQIVPLLEPLLPSWVILDWYRAGPISVNVSGGPSAAGFYLDDDHNLDNEVFDV